MEAEEAFVEFAALVFEDADDDFDACVAEHLYSFAGYQRIWVKHADYDASDTFLDDKFGTGRCLAVMGTRLERDEESTIFKIED